MQSMANENNNESTTNSNNNSAPAGQHSPSWPSVNTSTSENMNRLQISKSDEFDRVTKEHFSKK
jgi:hypothetical protein